MAEAAERTKTEAAGRRRVGLRDISEIRRYFHGSEDPIYLVSATNFNLLGLELDRARRLGLNPATETAQGAVGRERSAYAGRQRVEDRVAAGTGLHHRLDLGPVLVVVAERRERHRRLAWIAVAQDQEAGGRHTVGQNLTAQDRCGLGLQAACSACRMVSRVVDILARWFLGCATGGDGPLRRFRSAPVGRNCEGFRMPAHRDSRAGAGAGVR
jgi:hypothetical protein